MEKTSLFLRNNYHKTCQYTAPVSLNDTAEDTALSSSYLLVRAKSNGKNVFCLFCFPNLKAAKALLYYIRVHSVIVISSSYGDNCGVDNTLSCLPSEILRTHQRNIATSVLNGSRSHYCLFPYGEISCRTRMDETAPVFSFCQKCQDYQKQSVLDLRRY